MSDRALTRIGWLSVAVGGVCLIALQLVVLRDFDQWDPWIVALLLHGALATGAFAHGLTWCRGSPSLRSLAQLLVAAAALGWLHTWFEPLPTLIAWLRNIALGWFAP